MATILGVIVTYHPDPDNLRKLVNSALPQVDHLLIIDNHTPDLVPESYCFSTLKVSWLRNSQNLGVAAAYNQGVKAALALEASHILLFDQDSCPANDMVSVLLAAMNQYSNPDNPIAAAGPNYSDIKGQDRSPFVRLTGVKLVRIDCRENEIVEVDHLISSGCLINLICLQNIGYFTEDLFIDYVDTEWCWRARRKNYRLIGVGSAKMTHNLGDRQMKVFGKRYPLHPPFRIYYLMRNQWWMIRQSWVGWQWRVMDIMRSIKIIFIYLMFSNDRNFYLKAIFKGLYDALRNRMGKLEHIDRDIK